MAMKQGDRGVDVKQLQGALNRIGIRPRLEVDGVFGAMTAAAVRKLQAEHELETDGIAGRNTIKLLNSLDMRSDTTDPIHTLPLVLQRIKSLGFKVYDKGAFNLNLFGIRKADGVPDKFDDLIGAAYKDQDGNWCVNYWPATTDCGLYFLHKPANPAGSAILVADQQYEECWTKDLHRGKYAALCQRAGKVKVYRDRNKDSVHDHDPEEDAESIAAGYYGINIHRSTTNPDRPAARVYKWSAGCQVHASIQGFNHMMRLVDLQVQHTGIKTFTYTLLEEW